MMAVQVQEPPGSGGSGRRGAGGARRAGATPDRPAPGGGHPAPGSPPLAGASSAPEVDRALRALADGNRRAILQVIRSAPQPVGVIAQEVGLSQQAASHHLGVLRQAGLAASTQEGTRHLYAVRTDGLAAVRSYLDGFWPARLAALKAAVEEREEAQEAWEGQEAGPGESGEAAGHG